MRPMKESHIEMLQKYIDSYWRDYGVAPTYGEISCATGIAKSTISRYLKHMESCGMLRNVGSRNIVTERQKKVNESAQIPLIGRIACGNPRLAEENIEGYFRIPLSFLGGGSYFLLRASGDSMIEAGIEDGDLVLIRQQNQADPGQIVVALTEDDATLKRYFPEPEQHRIRLHPENRNLQDIYVENCIIQGVAVKTIKINDVV